MQAPQRFVERPRELDAWQVTADNAEQVATWCGGHVITLPDGTQAVSVPIGRSNLTATIGMWVIRRIDGARQLHHQPLLERDLFHGWEPGER